MPLPAIRKRWSDPVVVCASGPSLTQEVAEIIRGAHEAGSHRVVAVNDAYRLLPFADVLYACDAPWWDLHKGCPDFAGEKWSSHGNVKEGRREAHNDKLATAARYGLQLVQGKGADGFSLDPALIHYGQNSGFQAGNLAGLFTGWAETILLCGFDMQKVGGRRHFFGEHPQGMAQTDSYKPFIDAFVKAAKMLPPSVSIINCTPGSALPCFPMMDLQDALSAPSRRRDAAVGLTAAA